MAVAIGLACRIVDVSADGAHGEHFAYGSPGNETDVTRVVEVRAFDDLRFTPSKLEVRRGETVRFLVSNAGRVRHEFSIGDRAGQREHARLMREHPGMVHGDSANTVVIEPGETKSLIWKFDKRPPGPIEIACHVGGHYEGGMKIAVRWPK